MRNFLKKLAVVIFGTSLMAFSCSKDDDLTIPFESLPTDAQTFVKEFFNGISVVKTETEGDGGFSVNLSNGVEIDFDRNGNWTKVDARDGQALPSTAFIPTTIVEYVAQNYPNNPINGIERKTTGYEVELVGVKDDIYFDILGNRTTTKPINDPNQTVQELPQAANTFLSTYFKDVKVSSTKFETNEIEVHLANGVKVDFDLKGNWKEVDAADRQPLPNTDFIPATIKEYVAQNYPNNAINGIEKKATGDYEVELVGLAFEVVFDANGTYKHVKD